MVLEKLQKLMEEHLGIDPGEVTAETTFESLGIDSLDTVEMLMDLEEELGVELELDEKITTIGELVAFIEKKVG
ncbi:MAG: acyl carrier protein [Oscillospiraceae bacterium]|nr:acyl carrier protein [Oscillospiraceae bacterium]